MPRQARLGVPGALHHIMVRGINRSAVFKDDQDKVRFLDRLSQNISEGHCFIYAWVLIDNHIHLLFRSGTQGISAVMRKLLTWPNTTTAVTVAPAISSKTVTNQSFVTKKPTFSSSFALSI